MLKSFYGGVGGELSDCLQADIDDKKVCNNCSTLKTLKVCNRRRIYDNLNLTITFFSDSDDIESATTKLFYEDKEISLANSVTGVKN